LALFNSHDITAFVVIIRDEAELLAQQKEAEIAKKQSETLLFQSLPSDIAARLNADEKGISFSIEFATVMFIDVVKFTEYAANLTPQGMMGNLSRMFAGFDEVCAKYPLLTKNTLLGDVHLCAGGLFSPDTPLVPLAQQMIRFALEALQVRDWSASNLGVSVSEDRNQLRRTCPCRCFDSIGDAINVAVRLQSTGIPSTIQISESTQLLLLGRIFQ
jgi:class 3 adenylate cyclase